MKLTESSSDQEFSAFLEAEGPHILATARAICGPNVAEDVMQEALWRLYRAWPRIRSPEARMAYVATTMLRLAARWGKRASAREIVTELGSSVFEGVGTADRVEIDDQLIQALRALPLERRAVLALRFCLDMSVADTADVLGVPEGTVKSQCSRGLEQLRRSLTSANQALGVPDDRF